MSEIRQVNNLFSIHGQQQRSMLIFVLIDENTKKKRKSKSMIITLLYLNSIQLAEIE